MMLDPAQSSYCISISFGYSAAHAHANTNHILWLASKRTLLSLCEPVHTVMTVARFNKQGLSPTGYEPRQARSTPTTDSPTPNHRSHLFLLFPSRCDQHLLPYFSCPPHSAPDLTYAPTGLRPALSKRKGAQHNEPPGDGFCGA